LLLFFFLINRLARGGQTASATDIDNSLLAPSKDRALLRVASDFFDLMKISILPYLFWNMFFWIGQSWGETPQDSEQSD